MDNNQLNQEIGNIERFIKDKIREYHGRALRNQKDTKRGRTYILIFSWLATVLVALLALPSPSLDSLGLSPGWLIAWKATPFVLNIAALVASLTSSGLSTWLKTGIYEKKWEEYQVIYDNLADEYFCYETGIEEYNLDDKYARAKLLANRAKSIWTDGGKEIRYKTTLKQPPFVSEDR